jgi:hypothetical protein
MSVTAIRSINSNETCLFSCCWRATALGKLGGRGAGPNNGPPTLLRLRWMRHISSNYTPNDKAKEERERHKLFAHLGAGGPKNVSGGAPSDMPARLCTRFLRPAFTLATRSVSGRNSNKNTQKKIHLHVRSCFACRLPVQSPVSDMLSERKCCTCPIVPLAITGTLLFSVERVRVDCINVQHVPHQVVCATQEISASPGGKNMNPFDLE